LQAYNQIQIQQSGSQLKVGDRTWCARPCSKCIFKNKCQMKLILWTFYAFMKKESCGSTSLFRRLWNISTRELDVIIYI